MRCANLLAVADTSDPALARIKKLAAARARAEKAYRRAVAEERDEIARLLETEEAGTVAIAESIGRTREAVRLAYKQWQKAQGHDVSSGHAGGAVPGQD